MKMEYSEIGEDSLPQRARAWSKCPSVLWISGNISVFDGPLVAVVGSRKVSLQGKRRSFVLAKALADLGITVVSGLAEGVDSAAHEAALRRNGKTIAVMGTPIDQCFPSKNKELKERIATDGLVVSQFPSGTETFPSNFPRRNELMAAISHMTIVVEASVKSGTRHQVAACLKLGRPVGFLSSLIALKISWVEEALASGLGFEVRTVQDVLSKINGMEHFLEDSKYFPVKKKSSTVVQTDFLFLDDVVIKISRKDRGKKAPIVPDLPKVKKERTKKSTSDVVKPDDRTD
jgi:DNA processing protein